MRLLPDITLLALLAFSGSILFAAIDGDRRGDAGTGRFRERLSAWSTRPCGSALILLTGAATTFLFWQGAAAALQPFDKGAIAIPMLGACLLSLFALKALRTHRAQFDPVVVAFVSVFCGSATGIVIALDRTGIAVMTLSGVWAVAVPCWLRRRLAAR